MHYINMPSVMRFSGESKSPSDREINRAIDMSEGYEVIVVFQRIFADDPLAEQQDK